jgi:hypothetical protein
MKKRKNGPRNLSALSTLFPNQTHNARKNEMIRKPFVECKQKSSLKPISNPKNKNIQNSKEIKDPLSNKLSGPNS